MKSIFAKHLPYENGHLGEVTHDMIEMGEPTIRVMKYQNEYYALEGSHRIAAAHHLGKIPKLVIEIEETNTLPDSHWDKVSNTLPEYEFSHFLVLDLNSFKGENK